MEAKMQKALTVPTVEKPIPTLSDSQMATLQSVLVEKHYQIGEVVCKYGDPANKIYFVVKGRVEIYLTHDSGEIMTLETVGKNRCFGEVAVLYGGTRSASVKADEFTTLLCLDADKVDDFIKTHPDITRYMMECMAQRLVRSSKQFSHAPLRNANIVAEKQMSWQDRFFAKVVEALGSLQFLVIFLVATVAWVVFRQSFDREMQWLSLALSVLEISVATLVLISQVRAQKHEKALADTEFDANIAAEREIRNLHAKADDQRSLILELKQLVEKEAINKTKPDA